MYIYAQDSVELVFASFFSLAVSCSCALSYASALRQRGERSTRAVNQFMLLASRVHLYPILPALFGKQ